LASPTVDHRLRAESAAEAAGVSRTCAQLGVPHVTLPVTVAPGASLQARARQARYEALAMWSAKHRIPAVLTAHHLDDQAETLLMRLARGAGVGGLAGVRESRELAPGVRLVRPLLRWRKQELIALVERAGLEAVDDPANRDFRHDRTKARAALQQVPGLDPEALAASASWLGEVDAALRWTVGQLAADRVRLEGDGATLMALDLPPELQRRLLLAAMKELGAPPPRGADLHRAVAKLSAGGRCTLGGLVMSGGDQWILQKEIRAARSRAVPADRVRQK
jgi:tRNA(Ile)-lysidine synthase